MSRTPAQRPRLRALARAISWHRRKLAVVAAVAAVLTGVSAALPPPPPTTEVVQASARLDGGLVITEADVRTVRLPADVVPDGALTEVSAAVGQTVTAPVARGAVLTELSVVAPSRSVRAGRVVAPLRLGDPEVAGLLSVGQLVDVVAADTEAPQAAVVARNIRVVALPRPAEESGVGVSAGSATGAAGSLVLVEVDSRTATLLAQAAVTATLSVVLR
jgi:Flp pilus assembly protein CpaB